MDIGWRQRLRYLRMSEVLLHEAYRTGSDRMVALAEAVHAAEDASLVAQEARLLLMERPTDDTHELVLMACEDARAAVRRVDALVAAERARFGLA